MRCACCKGYGSILVAGIVKMPCSICGGKGEVSLASKKLPTLGDLEV